MILPVTFLVFAAALAVLLVSSERLLNSLGEIGQRLKISEAALAFFLVAAGTSLPELVASVFAAAAGDTELGIANLFGSNLTNSLLIGGLLLMLVPAFSPADDAGYAVKRNLMLGASLLSVIALRVPFTATAAAGLAVFGIGALAYVLSSDGGGRTMQNQALSGQGVSGQAVSGQAVSGQGERRSPGKARALYAACGFWLCLMIVGGYVTVQSVESLALHLNVSATFAGLVFLALGTSLPELVTTLVAVRQGKAGVAFAGLLGSNLVNVSLVLSLTLYAGLLSAKGYAGVSDAGIRLALTAGGATLLLSCIPLVPRHKRLPFAALLSGLYGAGLFWLA